MKSHTIKAEIIRSFNFRNTVACCVGIKEAKELVLVSTVNGGNYYEVVIDGKVMKRTPILENAVNAYNQE